MDNIVWNTIKGYYKVKISRETKETDILNIQSKINDNEITIQNKKDVINDFRIKQIRLSKQIENVPDEIGYNLTKQINKIENEKLLLLKEITALQKQIQIFNEQIEAIKIEDSVFVNPDGELIVKNTNIDHDFILRQDAVKNMINRVDLYKYDTDIRIIQIEMKAGYKINVLYYIKNQKYALSLIDDFYKFDKESFTFKKSLSRFVMNYQNNTNTETFDDEKPDIEETPLQTLENAGLIKSEKPIIFIIDPKNKDITRMPNFYELIKI
jgi:hypothetical protein